MSRQQPPQQPPPVQRLRLRYAKRGRLRFSSHRDFSRAFERALVRAGVPMAYSSGFNPHPRISYAGAAPTGAASEAEYLEIGLAEPVEPEAVHEALGRALPPGLDVVAVVDAGPHRQPLADLLQASRWEIRFPASLDTALLDEAVAGFLATGSVLVERMTKKGLRELDCRAAVVSLTTGTTASDAGPGLDLVLRHQEPSVRPDDVLSGLGRGAGTDLGAGALLTRLEQGPLHPGTGGIGDPFAGLSG